MSKKRKHRRRLSSSSEEDGEVLPGQDVISSHKSVRKKCVGNSQESSDKREKAASSDSQSPRQVKKQKTKKKVTKQSAADEGICYTESRGDCAPVYSSKAEKWLSKNEKTIKGHKTTEQTPPKVMYTKHACSGPPSMKTSKARSKKDSSRHNPSTSQKQKGTCSFDPAEQEEQRQQAKKTKCNAVEPLWTGNYTSAIKTKGSSSTSSEDAAQQNREDLIKKNCGRHHTKFPEDKKSSRTDRKHASYFSTKIPPVVEKHTASERLKKHTSVSGIVESDQQKKSDSLSTQKQICSLMPAPLHFKIPKKIPQKSVETIDENDCGVSTNTNLKHDTKLTDSEVVVIDSNEETVEQVQSCVDATPHCSFERHDRRPASFSGVQSAVDTNTDMCDDQMHVVEQLYLARSERRLEVNVLESYGELTCMDIDPPEEGSTNTQYKQPQQDLILVLDTNILLSHLDYVKKISSKGLKALGFPCILIPWVVLQELDSLKKGRGLSGSVAHLAIPAISFIFDSLRSRKPHIWGQSMQQAAERNGLNAENNDDRVLQCCLQYRSLYPESALILCTNDKNLCSKALLSGVKALTKNDLKTEAERSHHGVHKQHRVQGLMPPYVKSEVSSSLLKGSCSKVHPNVQESGGFSAGFLKKDNTPLCKADKDGTAWDLSRCISELEDCLREVLSDVLEAEMKSIYDNLWTEIVCRKPPWTLLDVLKCFRKHWIAVFRYLLPESSLQTVVNLINFFSSGNDEDHITTVKVLEEARDLVELLKDRSNQVPQVLSVMDKISTKLHRQETDQSVEGESSNFDVVMTDDDGGVGRDDNEEKEVKQSSSPQVSHQEVWAMFDSIWTIVVQTSMEVFKALGFDTRTMQSVQPAGGCMPPQDALVCLHKLSTMVSQLLQGFSSVLSLNPDMEEVQILLSIIHSYKIAGGNSSVTTKHLLDCFLQPEYREKLQLGGRQLMDLQDALNCCIQANALTFTT
ncbi:transcriptional protein SWT1 [Salarias fasciatus]|uniref:Transcriptional protein SWT1 n=1 Tax=Salarias fasciatus TaxID=181472 RepID=A0A672JD20_SALFA|nr:transcriptional protein SWT1 [Salarias fasciatus]XP_029939586.1 transcriptional protein SWT1 [Salarias fasciatus]